MEHAATQPDNSIIEQEHAVQIGMIDLLGQAVAEGKPESDKVAILDQLIAYTDIHFMSEQLIMRQHSYEGFEQHDTEHDRLMEQLQAIKSASQTGGISADTPGLMGIRSLLLTHIATEDRKLTDFLNQQNR